MTDHRDAVIAAARESLHIGNVGPLRAALRRLDRLEQTPTSDALEELRRGGLSAARENDLLRLVAGRAKARRVAT
jgi:hypothetical protein